MKNRGLGPKLSDGTPSQLWWGLAEPLQKPWPYHIGIPHRVHRNASAIQRPLLIMKSAKKHGPQARCRICQASLPAGDHGVCRNCTKAEAASTRSPSSESSFEGSLASKQRRGFYERHKSFAVLMVLIVFIAPIFGVFLKGVPGLLLGAIIPIVGYYLIPYLAPRLVK